MELHTTPRGVLQLSPYEILFGKLPNHPLSPPETAHSSLTTLNVDYVLQLQKQLKDLHHQVGDLQPVPTLACHNVKPGDNVMIRKFLRSGSFSERWAGPFQVLMTTPSSVKVEGRGTWIHASHCKRVTPIETEASTTAAATTAPPVKPDSEPEDILSSTAPDVALP